IKVEDFQKTKAAYIKNFDINKKENGYWLNWMQLFNNNGIKYADEYLGVVNAITNEDISSIAKTVLKNGNMKRIIMYPKTK
ncbi:MAG: hypothetical protein RR141_01860, partial [Rikenellaceae bacterium]